MVGRVFYLEQRHAFLHGRVSSWAATNLWLNSMFKEQHCSSGLMIINGLYNRPPLAQLEAIHLSQVLAFLC